MWSLFLMVCTQGKVQPAHHWNACSWINHWVQETEALNPCVKQTQPRTQLEVVLCTLITLLAIHTDTTSTCSAGGPEAAWVSSLNQCTLSLFLWVKSYSPTLTDQAFEAPSAVFNYFPISDESYSIIAQTLARHRHTVHYNWKASSPIITASLDSNIYITANSSWYYLVSFRWGYSLIVSVAFSDIQPCQAYCVMAAGETLQGCSRQDWSGPSILRIATVLKIMCNANPSTFHIGFSSRSQNMNLSQGFLLLAAMPSYIVCRRCDRLWDILYTPTVCNSNKSNKMGEIKPLCWSVRGVEVFEVRTTCLTNVLADHSHSWSSAKFTLCAGE